MRGQLGEEVEHEDVQDVLAQFLGHAAIVAGAGLCPLL